MGKIIGWVLVIAAAVWVYYNVDFSKLGGNAVNSAAHEKTINKVRGTRSINHQQAEDAANY